MASQPTTKTVSKISSLATLLLLLGLSELCTAANQPCSGKKGDIARCDGELFVCNDGSISGSKRNCSAERHSGNAAELRTIGNSGSRPCGEGTLCTGPKGGQYCIKTSGNKSYRRSNLQPPAAAYKPVQPHL
jgi:hypothetical protein